MYLIVVDAWWTFGGTQKWTALLLAELQRRGHRVLFLCRNREVAEHVAAFGIPTDLVRLGGDVSFAHSVRFARLLREHRPDAVLFTSFHKIWLGGIATRMAGVPRVLARIGSSNHKPHRWKYRFVIRQRWVDLVSVNAERMRTACLHELEGVDPRRVITVYDGVARPERTGPPGLVRHSLGLPPEAQVIGAVARLANEQKRFDRLFHALADLPPHVHCIIAGDGPDREMLKALADELGIRSRVHLLGYRTDIGNVLDALDVYVISSDFEGMANAMLEAMSAGLPIVSTPVSGTDEALDPFPDGTVPGLIVGFAAAELASALRGLLSDSERLRSMGEVAARRWAERFGFDRMVDEWEALLWGDPAAVADRGAPASQSGDAAAMGA